MNLHKFQLFTYIYFIILMITVIISSVIKKYDFLLGIYLFTVPVLVVGFITVWFQSNNKHISKQGFSEKLINDILLHWIPFFTFMYILFIVQPKINNQLWFWLGYSFIIVSSIVYFLNVIFPDKNISKINSLYSGVRFGMGYKILQRTYKYGGRSILNNKIKMFENKTLNNAFTGSLIGAGEIILLPFDIFKIRMQTNPSLMKGKNVLDLFQQEGLKLYRGNEKRYNNRYNVNLFLMSENEKFVS